MEEKSVDVKCGSRRGIVSDIGSQPNAVLPLSQTVHISFSNLSYSVRLSILSRERKEILKGINGLFRAGELTAIMGPSGAGKSTLMNVLSGFIKDGVGGSIATNGTAVDMKKAQIKSLSAYIMHQDNLNPVFTVDETMMHSANMKLGNRCSQTSKKHLIEKILKSMSLSEAGSTRCSRLSGGERKRLNVCLELVDNPPVLFLDEPTTGLDSSNCRLLVSELKDLAKTNRTVICTIHQPSAAIFSMFDHLYLIESGRTMYQGDPAKLLSFLEHVGLPCPLFHNPADFVMDVVVGEFGSHSDKLISACEGNSWRENNYVQYKRKPESPNGKVSSEGSEEVVVRKSPSEWIRYLYLVEQICRIQNRDWVMTYLKVTLHIMSALSIGVMFFKFGDDATKVFSNTIFLFLTSVYISHTTVLPATVKFPQYMLVLKREHFNNWFKFKTFFLAFCTVNIPLQLLFSGIFLAISYVMTDQPLELNRMCLFAISTALETIISDMVGLMMGTIEVSVNGIFIGSVYLTVTMLLGGYFAPIRNLLGFLRFLSYFSFMRYSFELKLTAIYGLGRGNFICPKSEFYCHVRHPKTVFDFIGLEDGHITRDMTALVTFTVATTLLAFYRLRYVLKKFH